MLIHSSLPGSEPVFVLHDGRPEQRPIEEVVRKQLRGFVAAFDPETFEVGYEPITGWYEGPPDKIYEVVLASGRTVRVTAGHNLFTLDRHGDLRKIRTGELGPGIRVAIPHRIPDPPRIEERIDVARLVPESSFSTLVCEGPTIAAAFAARGAELRRLLVGAGYKHAYYYAARARLPLRIVMADPALAGALGPADRITAKGGRNGIAASIAIDGETAWLLGIYVAEGARRADQFTVSNTDPVLLDRIESALRSLGLPVYRAAGAITCCSSVGSMLLGWLGTGDHARSKRIPPMVFGWRAPLMEAFLEGLVDGGGSRDASRTSVWTNSAGLAGDVLLLAERLGRRAGSCRRDRGGRVLYQVYLSGREHKLLTSVPLPDQLLIEAREAVGLDQAEAGREIGDRHPSDLNNIEPRTGRDAVRFATLRRIRDAYARRAEGSVIAKLDRLIDGDLLWDTVVEVRDTGGVETIFDIEVRPGGRRIENFVAGRGGVFVSNTAGFVDAGWDGHLTLELSNVANLPITLYPGMKIGQISFLRMTSEAEAP
ncbi:MAG: dCTP deaminase domain-containing protein, partial [Actinomycetota bacterium]